MTLPIERTRAQRWGSERLWDLRSAGDLTTGQHQTVEQILAHYPTLTEIAARARSSRAGTGHHLGAVDWLVPEPHGPDPLGGDRVPGPLRQYDVSQLRRFCGRVIGA